MPSFALDSAFAAECYVRGGAVGEMASLLDRAEAGSGLHEFGNLLLFLLK
jgi:hypothetical protein